MTQRRRSQGIVLLLTVVFSAMLLWALAAVVWPVPGVYADPPTDITLSNSSVAENEPINTTIGTFSTTDPDSGETYTYTLVSGTGDTDNGSFNILGDALRTSEVFDFETKSSYSIRVQTDDGNGGTFQKQFAITVTDINEPPDAVDDTRSTDEDTPITISVLSNDSDPEGVPLTVSAIGTPTYGNATTNGTTVTYTPTNRTMNYAAVFTYTASDGGLTDTATVTVTVTADNDPPVANNDTYSATEGVTLTVTAPGVLANDSDVENDTLTATLASAPSHGTLTLNPNGSFTYVHDGTTSSDSFTYRAYDGTAYSNVATATINIQLFAPVITAITVTSSSPTYFYAPGLGVTGGQVFFNSLSGEGGGQTITVTISFTDAHPYSLTGSPAFGDPPGSDTSGPPWTLTYTIETDANSEPNRVFTVTDKAGLTDTAVINFTQDNVDPAVELTDVTNPGYDYDPDWGQFTDELDIDGSNWYNAGDFIGTRWYFTSTTSDVGAAGLASGSAFWDHSNGTTYDQTKNCGSDGSDFFSNVSDDPDGVVTVTVTISDRVGNLASDRVVFNIDNTSPQISSPSIEEYDSPYLHVLGSNTIYYGDGMGTSPQPFDVKGQAQQENNGVGLDKATYPPLFGTTPDPTDLKGLGPGWHDWFGTYNVRGTSCCDGTIPVTVSDLLGNSRTQLFAYFRDVAHPTVVLTDVTNPDYDPDGNELNTTGNWYRPGGLTSGWAFTSTTNDSGAGLGSGSAFWNHSNGTTYDQTTVCGPGGDGAFTGVSDDGSGTVTVTVTITDNVANATTSVPLVIRLDGTPPSVPGSFAYQNDTDSGGDGIAPLSGYYDNAVIQLQWNASTDSGSGLPTNPYHLGTAPHPTSGSYAEDSSYDVGSSGTYTIYLTAEDNVGNISNDAVTGPVTVDTLAPQGSVNCPASAADLSFAVSWSATDQGPAGLRSNPYSVWYNIDGGDWQNWLMDTSATAGTFGPDSPVTVAYGRIYCFRMRAVDRAGNVAYTAGNNCTVTIDPAANLKKVFLPLFIANPNWGFETGDFTNWQHGGQLAQSVQAAPYSGSYAALLGSTGYPCSGVPVGSAWLRRSVSVPSSGSPTLSFWYRIYTQDKNSTLSDQYDLFAVYINDSQLVVKDANTSDPYGCSTLKDLGWKQVNFSLDVYRGQTIQITFYNYNRAPVGAQWYNTYTYIDDVSVQ